MTSGKERRRAARAELARKLSEQHMKRTAELALDGAAAFIESKLDQSAGAFLNSRNKALRNAAVLDASTSGSNGPIFVISGYNTGGTAGLVYVPPMCVRCSARPIVSSVRSRAAYCEQHWLELWNAGT